MEPMRLGIWEVVLYDERCEASCQPGLLETRCWVVIENRIDHRSRGDIEVASNTETGQVEGLTLARQANNTEWG